jgi:hypothetical protein
MNDDHRIRISFVYSAKKEAQGIVRLVNITDYRDSRGNL